MTAAGIALIAGGLATLIGFRRALWAGGGRRRRPSPAIEPARRRELTAGSSVAARALPAARRAELPGGPPPTDADEAEVPEAEAEPRSFRHRRRRSPDSGLTVTVAPVDVLEVPDDEPVSRFGLASIGLAGEDEDADDEGELRADRYEEDGEDIDDEVEASGRDDAEDAEGEIDGDAEVAAEVDEEEVAELEELEEAEPEGPDEPEDEEPPHRRMARAVLARSLDVHPELAGVDAASVFGGTRAADRVEGWVRPDYDDNLPTGDYWKPVSGRAYADLDGAAYGWPVPIERLPVIPPAGDRPDEELEPTGVLPQWPPARPSGR